MGKTYYTKKVKFYLLPMIPVIFLWISFLLSTKFNFNVLIILGLLWCLIIEIFLLKQLIYGFLKIRLIATILSLIPLFQFFLLFKINDIGFFFIFFS